MSRASTAGRPASTPKASLRAAGKTGAWGHTPAQEEASADTELGVTQTGSSSPERRGKGRTGRPGPIPSAIWGASPLPGAGVPGDTSLVKY